MEEPLWEMLVLGQGRGVLAPASTLTADVIVGWQGRCGAKMNTMILEMPCPDQATIFPRSGYPVTYDKAVLKAKWARTVLQVLIQTMSTRSHVKQVQWEENYHPLHVLVYQWKRQESSQRPKHKSKPIQSDIFPSRWKPSKGGMRSAIRQ